MPRGDGTGPMGAGPGIGKGTGCGAPSGALRKTRGKPCGREGICAYPQCQTKSICGKGAPCEEKTCQQSDNALLKE
jgi:hypothetical protein